MQDPSSKTLRLFEMGVKPILTALTSPSSYNVPFAASFHDIFISDKSACFSRMLSEKFFEEELSFLPNVLTRLAEEGQNRSAAQDWIARETGWTVREALLLLKEAHVAKQMVDAILQKDATAQLKWIKERRNVIRALIYIYNARLFYFAGLWGDQDAMVQALVRRLAALRTLNGTLANNYVESSDAENISVTSVLWNGEDNLCLSHSRGWEQATQEMKAKINGVLENWFPSKSRWSHQVSYVC